MDSSVISSVAVSAVSAIDSNLAAQKLESATEERLAKAFDESTPSAAIESVEASTLSSVTESVVSSVTESVVESTVSAVKAADEVKLSEAYYRAAVHQGWKPEEIKEFLKANPEVANRTFAKMYDDTNKMSREFANIGRAKQELSKKGTVSAATVVESPEKKSEFKEIDIEKLRKDYDNDPVIEIVAQQQKQVKALLDQVQKTTKEPDQPVKDEATIRASIQEEAALEQQIVTFFTGNDLKMYNDFYGALPKDAKDWDTLTQDQKVNRWNVLQMADQMLIGATSQGRDMGVDEALTLAHLSVSEPMREKVIRDKIKANVVKRNKGLSLKPSSGKKPESTKPGTPGELVAITRERLNAVKW